MNPFEQYKRETFDRFSTHLSEGGKYRVFTNRACRFVAFVMPVAEMPELILTHAGRNFELSTEVLGWVFFYRYAAEAWRIRGGESLFFPRLINIPNNVMRPKTNSYWSSSGDSERFELSLHDSEIDGIDASALKKFVMSILYGSSVYWPVKPWTTGGWSYQWTKKGERHLDTNKSYDRKGTGSGYLTWEQVQAKKPGVRIL